MPIMRHYWEDLKTKINRAQINRNNVDINISIIPLIIGIVSMKEVWGVEVGIMSMKEAIV